jgi:hypothetical protein
MKVTTSVAEVVAGRNRSSRGVGWWVKGVGPVKMKIGAASDELGEITLVLTSYHLR